MKTAFFVILFSMIITLPLNIKAQASANEFWKKFQIAYTAKDKATLTKIIELPVRENLYPDNPSLNLTQFLSEVNMLGKYKLNKAVVKLYGDIKVAARFEGYKASPTAKFYEVQLARTVKETFYSMALYIKLDKGVFKLFAFDPEVSAMNTGD